MELFARLALQSPRHVQEANAQVHNVVRVSCVVACVYRGGREGNWRTHPCDAQRSAPLRLCIRVYEVPQPLDLREIEPAALVRAARELARRGRATRWDAPERG